MISLMKFRMWSKFLLLPLLLGSSVCLLKYAGWSAVVSGHYGLPSHQDLVNTATHQATLYFWAFLGLVTITTATVAVILPPFLEHLSAGVKGTLRFTIALGMVILANIGGGYLLVKIGEHFK